MQYINSYKANPMSILQKEIDEETGLEKERLVNKQRFKGLTMIQINFEQEVRFLSCGYSGREG